MREKNKSSNLVCSMLEIKILCVFTNTDTCSDTHILHIQYAKYYSQYCICVHKHICAVFLRSVFNSQSFLYVLISFSQHTLLCFYFPPLLLRYSFLLPPLTVRSCLLACELQWSFASSERSLCGCFKFSYCKNGLST